MAATPAQNPPAGQTAAVPPAPATAAKSASEKAPDGVYYLIGVARVETSAGVQNLPVGTGVRRIRPGVYQTPIGEAALSEDKLTNDLAMARTARDAAAAAQAAMRPPAGTAQTAAPKISTPPIVKGTATMPAAPAVQDANHANAVRKYELEHVGREIASLEKQYDALQQQYFGLAGKKAKEDTNRIVKGRTVTSNTDQLIVQVQGQIAAVQGKIDAAYARKRSIQ